VTRTLVCIHTLPLLVDEFERLGHAIIADLKMMHILDEPLLARVQQANGIGPEEAERLASHIRLAHQVGARAVLVTCSTLSPAIAGMRAKAPIPLIAIDEGMAALAVAKGERIGVVATAESTMVPTRTLLMAQAAQSGRRITLTMRHVAGALELLLSGDGEVHDQLVKKAVEDIASEVEVVVLAQASMARVLEIMPEDERKVPLLSSPHIALAEARDLLGR
jgi:Asp/Glu/hydantoin racemase